LFALVSAWPCLQMFFINLDWGWVMYNGITPDGLLQLLQICLSLSHIAITIDTHNYTECPQSPASLRSTLPCWLSIDVVDSSIVWEEKSVLEISAFFASLGPCCHLKSDFDSHLLRMYNLSSFQSQGHKYFWDKIFHWVCNHVCQYFYEKSFSGYVPLFQVDDTHITSLELHQILTQKLSLQKNG
ncbi:hypothetical protein EV363DRAFT_1172355, partial [Boletus edulis]